MVTYKTQKTTIHARDAALTRSGWVLSLGMCGVALVLAFVVLAWWQHKEGSFQGLYCRTISRQESLSTVMRLLTW